jgi:hypothetical protein
VNHCDMSKDDAVGIVALAIEFFDLASLGAPVPAAGYAMLATQLEDLKAYLETLPAGPFGSN